MDKTQKQNQRMNRFVLYMITISIFLGTMVGSLIS